MGFFVCKHNEGKVVSIGIINDNEMLKDCYRKYGFEETGLRKFEHLSFTVSLGLVL
jgi:hypothetical protein